jgi:hypothetical protein
MMISVRVVAFERGEIEMETNWNVLEVLLVCSRCDFGCVPIFTEGVF